ncbi:MAG: 50S ribosomal protein L2 [Chlamydiia bacterium]
MLKKFRPVTPGQRHLLLEAREELTRKEGRRSCVEPEASLLKIKRRCNGRNNTGRITTRHRGGGARKFYREVDFKRDKEGIPARVASIEYDPNRSAFVALLHYVDGEKRYIVAPQGLRVGMQVSSGPKAPFEVGCSMEMRLMPLGSTIHNIELVAMRGGKMVRAAGQSAQLMAKADGMVTLRLPSGEMRVVHENCRATFGSVSNPEHNLRSDGKAGRRRWMGIRPTVRGTAMNPVDHPHGGGEGKHNGYIPQTPWAMQTKGYRTRCKRKVSSRFIIKDRRK